MNEYDQKYFFIDKADNEKLPSLTPDENTTDINFQFERLPIGSSPLVFFNGAKEYQNKQRTPSIKTLPDILFSGSDMLVRGKIREALLDFDIPYLHMHPAIYIHDDEKWHEDYWFLTFTERFECWDRTNSSFDPDPIQLGGYQLYEVYTYSLNPEMLSRIPLEQRLLFKMGGTTEGLVVCHKSLARLFRSGENNGAQLVLIPDY